MTDLVQRLRGIAQRHNMASVEEAASRIEALDRECDDHRRTVSLFHDAMQAAGWHPGRTDDLLTDIIKAKGAEMAQLERENAELRKDAARYKWLIEYFASDATNHDDAIIEASEDGPEAITAVIDKIKGQT